MCKVSAIMLKNKINVFVFMRKQLWRGIIMVS